MAQQIVRKLSLGRGYLAQHDYHEIGTILRTKAWSTERALGLSRDLAEPFPAPVALIPIQVRPIRPDDVRALLDVSEAGIDPAERRDRTTRLHLLDAGFTGCFVATTVDDQACYIQWLISPDENARLRKSFDGLFPHLADGEMLLEGAYTPAAFRGQRIMPAAMALIAEKAAALGASRALTFVGEDNVPSLKGCKRAGFFPALRREGIHRLGHRRMVFTPLPTGTPYAFDAPTAG